ncbi:MAG: hypothetical protein QM739_19720 [Propionivibrio sp.]
MSEQKKVPVSERALIARINRKLAKEPFPRKLCKARPGSRMESNCGKYHVINTYTNALDDYKIDDLEEWVKDRKVTC